MSIQSFYKLGVIAYFQLNRQYIAQVLCINKENPMTTCHGRCFLRKNLDLDREHPASTAPVGKEKVEIAVFLVSENGYSFYRTSPLPLNNTRYCLNYSSVNPDAPFHPPSNPGHALAFPA